MVMKKQGRGQLIFLSRQGALVAYKTKSKSKNKPNQKTLYIPFSTPPPQ
jgi:hypothetical protein